MVFSFLYSNDTKKWYFRLKTNSPSLLFEHNTASLGQSISTNNPIHKLKVSIYLPDTSGWNGKLACHILFCSGRNDKIHKAYLSTSY